jgi:hypothetical protein
MLLVDAFPDAISGSRFDSDQVVYDYNKYIKGAIFVEPAMTKDDLPSPNTCTNFPLLVTQSRHDHLNNLIFPIANIPYNTEYADDFDAFSSRYLTRPSNEQSNSFAARMSGIQGDIVGAVIGLPRFPLTVVESVLLWPPSWIYGQSIEIKKSGFSLRTNYLANTFAQLPVLDYPVREWLGDNSNYKGLFNLGVWNESASRISPTPPVSVASIVTSDNGLPFLNVPNGITYINAQEVIRRSIFNNPKFPRNIDYEKPSEDYTVGWVDPIGSHADYLPNPDVKDNPQIYSLFYTLIHDQRKNQNN